MRSHSSSNVGLLSLFVVGSTFALACSAHESDDGLASSSSPSASSPSALVTETVTVERTASGMRHATPVTGRLVTNVDGAAAATIAFFARHRAELGLEHPESSLAARNVDRDELGMTHVKLQQIAHGIPVRGAEIAAHYAKDGSLASLDAKIASGLDQVDATPALTSDAAFAAAQRHVAASDSTILPSDLRAEKAPALTFLPSGRLVYATRLAADAPTIMRVWTFVDAKTGDVESYDDLHRLTATAAGYMGQPKTVQIEKATNGYILRDSTRSANGIDTGDLKGGTDTSKGVAYVTSANGTTWDPIAVDASANTALVYDYYKQAHARLAYDGLGGNMASVVHYDKNLDNAFNTGGGLVVYGDGVPGSARPAAVALDTVAHEVTHGVTETSSALVYQQQSGALNEAVSDIFGAIVEHQYKPDAIKNWLHSDETYVDGKALRDMKSPRSSRSIGVDGLDYPRHMKEYVTLPLTVDSGGVHVNSLLIDHSAYLMAMGGTNEVSKVTVARGIGWENLAKVWYRANTRYFLSTTDFAEAAKGTIRAAKDLSLSADDQDTIECAWIATGVLEGTCKAKAPEPAPATDSKPKSQANEKASDDDAETSTQATKSSGKKSTPAMASAGCSAAPAEKGGGGALPVFLALAGIIVVGRRGKRASRV